MLITVTTELKIVGQLVDPRNAAWYLGMHGLAACRR